MPSAAPAGNLGGPQPGPTPGALRLRGVRYAQTRSWPKPNEDRWSPRLGGENSPAGTDCAKVIVVCKNENDCKLSHVVLYATGAIDRMEQIAKTGFRRIIVSTPDAGDIECPSFQACLSYPGKKTT